MVAHALCINALNLCDVQLLKTTKIGINSQEFYIFSLGSKGCFRVSLPAVIVLCP